MASCPLRLGPERHLFRTALRREEGWKPRPRKLTWTVERLQPSWTADARDPFHCFQSSFEKTRDKLIGVHCTHGVNRPGYLICR
ncbi:RNA/RNP complex-1-interacting phosphatase [Manis javanica]|nr:RNA/RNP complex-1-interacting phosphatase [Manis javanica]